MFSTNIQNYINTSGEAQMRRRIAQIEGYVSNLTPQKEVTINKDVKAEPFKDVLKATLENGQVFDIDAPPISNIKFGSLTNLSKASKTTNTNNLSNTPVSTTISYTKEQIMNLIKQASEKYGVDEKLVKAVIKQESGFNPKAKSKAGAEGLMQLMPQTAKSLGVKDSLNPAQNIDGGVRYLKSMLDKFHGNKVLALAAYNAGPNAVKKYNGIPPYKETQNYVMSILNNYL